MPTSRISGLYKLSPAQRRAALAEHMELDPTSEPLGLDAADLMIENVISTFELPCGVAVNLLVNGVDRVVPMVVEEPSVVAAVSNMARLVRETGGFTAECDPSVMIGQVQLVDVSDPEATVAALRAALPHLEERARSYHPELVLYGGGLRDMEIRTLRYQEPGQEPEDMVVLHFALDCADAMGANMINTIAEGLAPELEALTGERVGLRILSNLADRRLARASCRLRPDQLGGEEVARGIAQAWRFAWTDPYRAATHNKGVMNGVDAVCIATGNDWRAVEAGVHAFAARDGQYRPVTRWWVDEEGDLRGSIEVPMAVGTVGGTLRVHPRAQANLRLLGSPGARELAEIIASVGLAQNLGALRALAAEGIQQGHMRMHARSVAVAAGAEPQEVGRVVAALADEGHFTVERAQEVLSSLREG